MKKGERTKLIKKYLEIKNNNDIIVKHFKELDVLVFLYRIEEKWVCQGFTGKLKTDDITLKDKLKIIWLLLKPNWISITSVLVHYKKKK